MDELDRSFEPMDIDMSMNSTRSCQDFSIGLLQDVTLSKVQLVTSDRNKSGENNKNVVTEDEHVSRKPKKLIVNLKSSKPQSYLILFLSMIPIIFIILIRLFTLKCNTNFDTEASKQILTERLYGQEDKIESIVNSLQSGVKSKLTIFYGPIGVGKSYSIHLMFSQIWKNSNVYHFTMPTFKETVMSGVMTGFIFCPNSTLIVDGLEIKDLDVHPIIEKLFSKANNLGRTLTIVLIFSNLQNTFKINSHIKDYASNVVDKIQNEQFENLLNKTFESLPVPITYVNFNSLNNFHLRKCIDEQLPVLNVVNRNEVIDNLVSNFDVHNYGCKSVIKKIHAFTRQ